MKETAQALDPETGEFISCLYPSLHFSVYKKWEDMIWFREVLVKINQAKAKVLTWYTAEGMWSTSALFLLFWTQHNKH